MARIGILGSGIAGLHLGLRLQQLGVAATIYTATAPQQHANLRLPNIVIRSAPTCARERQLGIHDWDTPADHRTCIGFTVHAERALTFTGVLDQPVSVVDMRLYGARLLQTFIARGGPVVIGRVAPDQVPALAARHDLLVVAIGRGKAGSLFPRVAEHSPFDRPQRVVIGGLFGGVSRPDRHGLELVFVPGHGEIVVLPARSYRPGVTGIGFEVIPGGAFDGLRRQRYEDDPHAFTATVLDLLRRFAPHVAARIDPHAFGVVRPHDQLVAAVTPTVRRAYTRLQTGAWMLALGDAHVVNDPLTGQGANTASHAAWVVADAIRDAGAFDEAWCHDVEQRVWSYTKHITAACNAQLQPPPPHLHALMAAAAQHQAIADAFANGFNTPIAWWKLTRSADQTAALLAEHGWHDLVPADALADHR